MGSTMEYIATTVYTEDKRQEVCAILILYSRTSWSKRQHNMTNPVALSLNFLGIQVQISKLGSNRNTFTYANFQ